MLACTRRSSLSLGILSSAASRPNSFNPRQALNTSAGLIATDHSYKPISQFTSLSKDRKEKSKPRPPDQDALRKRTKAINIECKLTAAQKKLDITAILQVAKDNVGRLTGKESIEKKLKIKLKVAEETLKLLQNTPTPVHLSRKAMKATQHKPPTRSVENLAENTQENHVAQPESSLKQEHEQTSDTKPSTRQKRSSKLGSSSKKASYPTTLDIEATLATDILASNPLFDPTQAPEPSNSQSTHPDSSFSFSSSSIPFEPVIPSTSQPKVATLAHGLSRVLFNPGVHWLQDPRTMVYNFDHRLQDLISPDEFNFDALTPYITSSRDEQLINLAHENQRKYCGSTSSMTQTLSQIYLMLNGNRPLNVGMLTSNVTAAKVSFRVSL